MTGYIIRAYDTPITDEEAEMPARQDHWHNGPEGIPYANPPKHPMVFGGVELARDVYHSHDQGREPHTHEPSDAPAAYGSRVVLRDTGIYDRIIEAWPHLRTLAESARSGSIQARNQLATNVLSGAGHAPLTVRDIWEISKWLPTA